jgi:hypothetical protein
MRIAPFLAIAVVAFSACDPTGPSDVETVTLTLRLRLAGGRDVGVAAGKVYMFADSSPRPRASAFPEDGEECSFSTTPVTVCTLTVPRRAHVSLVVHEPDPAVVVRFAPASAQDTVRDGRYVEFNGWSACADETERGVCVVRPTSDATIEAEFQLMQQVTVYQTGAARMDYITIAAAATLKVPAQGTNILDRAGCRRVLNYGAPCDSVRLVGAEAVHRFTAYVPRGTIVGMFPVEGVETEFVRWDGTCIPASIYAIGVCSLISPDTSGAPLLLTARYTWWECAGGLSDRNTGSCILKPG